MAQEEYEPFGNEWKAEMMKWRKSDLVDLLRRNLESKISSHNTAMNAISLKAKGFLPKVKNGMDSWTIHNIREILATVAETAS